MVKFASVVAVSAGAVLMMFVFKVFAGRRGRRTFIDRLRANGV